MRGTSLSPLALDAFIDAACQECSVYFLGAGTSAAIIALVNAIPPVIKKRAVEAGIYIPSGYTRSSLRISLQLTPYEPGLTDREVLALSGTPEAAVRAYWDHLLISLKSETAALAYQRPPPEYAYFDLVSKGSTIVTTNNDGLSGWASPRLQVIELHGSPFDWNTDGQEWKMPLRAVQFVSMLFREQAESAQEFGERFGFQPNIVRPTDPVPVALLPRWEKALRLTARAESLIVIGYSLPPYDSMVRDLLVDSAKYRRIPIWVLSPQPLEVAENLHDLVLAPVQFLPVYWDLFSRAILAVARRRGARNLDDLRGAGVDVAVHYEILKHRRDEGQRNS